MRKQYRIYVYKPKNSVKNINIKKILALLTTGVVLGTAGVAISKTIKNNDKTEFMVYPTERIEETISYQYSEPVEETITYEELSNLQANIVEEAQEVEEQVEPVVEQTIAYNEPEESHVEETVATIVNGGDSVVAKSTVNMRLNQDSNSKKLGELPQGAVADRILSYGRWDLVRYNGQISFVSSEFTTNNSVDYNNEYYSVEPYQDIVRTKDRLHFRLGPSTDEYDFGLLDKNEELIVIGKSTSYKDPSDVWYVVRARGQIGFVKASYTRSLKDEVQRLNPNLTEIEVKKLGYLNEETALRDAPNGNIISYSDQYQLVQVLQTEGNYYLVNIDGQVGYVNKKEVKSVEDKFIVVDISTQRIYLYNNTDITYVGKCTTGKEKTPTQLGYYSPYGKGDSHEFPDGHKCRILWEPFNEGQGLHDAPWEENSDFGNPSYRTRHGSAGCVRLPDDVAEYVRDNTTRSQKILIKN